MQLMANRPDLRLTLSFRVSPILDFSFAQLNLLLDLILDALEKRINLKTACRYKGL
jgi:hypothetical protein